METEMKRAAARGWRKERLGSQCLMAQSFSWGKTEFCSQTVGMVAQQCECINTTDSHTYKWLRW